MYNGASPNSAPAQGPPNATPSPTANSDDSNGDSVTESKRLMAASGQNPGPVVADPGIGYCHNNNSTAGTMAHHYHHHHHHLARGVPVVQKRPRQGRRSKKKRDPNEPQKPVSAYALFFRDMQAGIKARNPNASFGEVSKHVASMWDNLNPDHKAAYKKRTENAKKEYLKQLAAYRANLVSKNPNDPYNSYSSFYKTSASFDYGSSVTHHAPAMGIPMGSPQGGMPVPGGGSLTSLADRGFNSRQLTTNNVSYMK